MYKVAMLLTWTSSLAVASDPHVHGKAHMDLVYSGNEIHMEFRSPMANLLGFEYQPQSKVEIFKYNKALKTLKNSESVAFSGINCSTEEVKVDAPWEDLDPVTEEEHHHHGEHEHQEKHDDYSAHDHEDDHKHEHHHKHDDDHDKKHDHHDHHDDHSKAHSDINVQSHFNCSEASGKVTLTLSFMQAFPALEEIQVNWITDSAQRTTQVTQQRNKVELN